MAIRKQEILRMTLEKLKLEFVKYMEAVRAGDPYPRNFIGCLMSILIEPEATSQERIMELTGYSQATVSLTLQKVQLLMPVRTVKKRRDRRLYYRYDGSPEAFILDLWQKRLQVQGIDIGQIEVMIHEVKESVELTQDTAIRRFFAYLNNMKLYLNLIHSLRASSIKLYEGVVETGSLEKLDYQEEATLEEKQIDEFLKVLRSKPMMLELGEEPPNEYLILKNNYFSGMKANLNPLYSQTIANQMMVLHDVFLEGLTTQERLEQSTLLPRSTISEILTQFVKLGAIEVIKKEASRIKLYRPVISFTDLMLSYSERLSRDATAGKSQLSEFISATQRIQSRSKEATKFLDVLNSLVKAYEFTHRFTMSFKAKMVTKLKEEYNRGFVFI